LQLARVLDQDDAGIDPCHLGKQRICERRLARAGAAGHEDVVALGDRGAQRVRLGLRHQSVGDVVVERMELLRRLADREAGR
jgi:hypothetical protein